jgi:hypothetical protein
MSEPARHGQGVGLALTTTTQEIVMATPSYRERMKAARAAASAQRRAEKAEQRQARWTMCEARRLALEAVKAGIRAKGDRVSIYSPGSLQAMADQMISPFLIAQAKCQPLPRGVGRCLASTGAHSASS